MYGLSGTSRWAFTLGGPGLQHIGGHGPDEEDDESWTPDTTEDDEDCGDNDDDDDDAPDRCQMLMMPLRPWGLHWRSAAPCN